MANKIGLVSAGLAVASGAMMTFIITTETFAVATLGGDESCELGTLGVFTSSYTPDCDPSKPGDAFSGDTLEFWPLFSSQNSFGGAFEALGVGATDELPEGWPAEEYDCATGVNGYMDDFAAGTEALWATVDEALQGVFFTLLQSNPLDPSTTVPNAVKPAVIAVGAATYGTVLSTPISLDPTSTETIAANSGATVSATSAALSCSGTPAPANVVTCFYLDQYQLQAAACADGSPWLVCLSAVSIAVIDVPFVTMFGGGGVGPLLGATYVAGPIAASGDQITAAQITGAFGLLNACYKFGYADFAACLTAAIPVSAGGPTGVAGLGADLTVPHILGCLFVGLDSADPLQGTAPVALVSPGTGCLGANTGHLGAATAEYASTYEVFQRISVDEILPIAPAGTEDTVAQLGTFAAIISGCADFYDVINGIVDPTVSCPLIVGEHKDGLDATEDPTHAALKAAVCQGALLPVLKLKATCIGSTAFWAVPQQVIEGVYTLDEAETYDFESVTAAGEDLLDPAVKAAVNKALIAAPAIAKCADDNLDAQAIEKAQALTPVGVALTFVGAVAGLVVAAMGGKVPKFAPLVPAVIVLTGAVIFMVALLGVRNAPVYELVGQPCPDGNTCYAAGTGNTMALPGILIGLISGVGLIVSAFLGGSGEDYSSFKETQVGMKA